MFHPRRHRSLWPVLLTLLAATAHAQPDVAALESVSRTGVIYDRVVPFAHLERLDGSASAPAVRAATWRQAYDELHRASAAPVHPPLATVLAGARARHRSGVIPLALIDLPFERIAPDGASLVPSRAVVAAALASHTYRGAGVVFALDATRCFFDPASPLRSLSVDFADGRGPQPIGLGEEVRIHYTTAGPRTLTARVTRIDGTTAEARFDFDVRALAAPSPDDTLHVIASIAHEGQFGAGDAYVYLAPGHAAIESPIVVAEGFDLDNSMNWDELYALLNRENLIESLRADGFDVVVLNFADATVAVEQNGFVVTELVQQLQAALPEFRTLAVAGASMGGLCTRYALAYMETHALPHRVRTWLSFDAPHGGANIPLGLQYWINFFSSQSADAAEFLAILQRPAARQMLLYHLTTPPGATGQADPLRAQMLAAFAAVGDWPSQPRRVAIANGSGLGTSQGFSPGAQMIRWEYSSLLVAITGNVWAVPSATSTTIFQGSTRILFTTTTQSVPVSGTAPWDGAPGGFRASLVQLDTLAAPYGDIVALHPAHCFIPTVSALALPTANPFFDVAGTPDLVSLTPFDAIYFPTVNQEHVAVTPENAAWIRAELGMGALAVSPRGQPDTRPALALSAGPNPFRGALQATYRLSRPAQAVLRVYDIGGREIRALTEGTRGTGTHFTEWDGRDARGADAGSGVFFLRLEADGEAVARRVVKLN